jgi:hypothetical protein
MVSHLWRTAPNHRIWRPCPAERLRLCILALGSYDALYSVAGVCATLGTAAVAAVSRVRQPRAQMHEDGLRAVKSEHERADARLDDCTAHRRARALVG